MVKYKAPANCPVCGGEYEITELTCNKCGSELKGRFEGCDFCSLSESDRYFVNVFIKCRGNIKDVEKELGISYPTVRSRLDGIIKKLGLDNMKTNESAMKEERKKVFQQLESGDITADQAAEILKNLKG